MTVHRFSFERHWTHKDYIEGGLMVELVSGHKTVGPPFARQFRETDGEVKAMVSRARFAYRNIAQYTHARRLQGARSIQIWAVDNKDA